MHASCHGALDDGSFVNFLRKGKERKMQESKKKKKR